MFIAFYLGIALIRIMFKIKSHEIISNSEKTKLRDAVIPTV